MSALQSFVPRARRTRLAAAAGLAILAFVWLGVGRLGRGRSDPALTATVRRGTVTATLTASGVLRPVQSITYRSPVAGRDVEIRELALEGALVKTGDLIVRLETADVDREVERAEQEARQAQMDLEVAEADVQEAEGAVKAANEGEGVLAIEEARTRLQLAEKKAETLRLESAQLKPLMERGYITRDEFARTQDALEQAEQELALAKKRTEVTVKLTHPRERERAALQLAQKAAQLGRARTRVGETRARIDALRDLHDACTIRAFGPGLVVYEENLNASPRRKIRVGDRVTGSQGIVTIPEVNRMEVNTTVSEPDMHRVHPGQTATIRVEAYPDLRLTGRVARVGTLASASAFRPLEEKRFDLIIDLDSAPSELRPDMTARADIVLGSRLNVLFVPVTAVFERQGSAVAYVAGASGMERRTVSLGETNGEIIEVTGGLAENERVLLVEPVRANGLQSR
jgi:multidrug resistance efflux pump